MNELHAWTIAIDSQGRELTVDLDDLYAMVRKMGTMGYLEEL